MCPRNRSYLDGDGEPEGLEDGGMEGGGDSERETLEAGRLAGTEEEEALEADIDECLLWLAVA